ncbi:hypothetical protein [Bifidobacterium miconisargentati]|uniref:hypothetical protein n=1 Tax=Bifidobacterium miconisargentati TaxID=2834437 RepID=UPI001BDD87F8|nr:hypothetical protein [Bifidobacterium miconisargentati]MBW3090161.1 hypothetical protein [Bifidobacterium miconisargentati]
MSDDARDQVPMDGGEPSGKTGGHRRYIARIAIAVIVAAVLVFAGAFAVGRSTENPTKDQAYLDVETKAAKIEEQVANNRKKTAELTTQRDDLREQAAKAEKQLENDKKAFGQYGGNTEVGAEPLTVESITLKPDTFYEEYGAQSGLAKYLYPEITVRNTSGHVIYDISLRMDIIGADGKVLKNDASAYVNYVVLYPGKTAVCEGMIEDEGFSGATLKPTGYYMSIPDTSGDGGSDKTTDSHEFGKDVKTVVIP